ncbi:MAG: protein-L-isoaspartate(D-aspartate) O-methyltransferase [Rhodospirillaceae bacterium]|nr:protein-L-isoaspartate(D-aspartate) O-methyltransferase [Rhodospirillaceae bacterium]
MSFVPDLSIARRSYAEELRAVAPVLRNESIIEAFATVPREQFTGSGPWLIHPPFSNESSYRTPSDDVRWLYHNVLVSIDEFRDLNNGQPSLWARLFDALDLRPGERVLQVGAGTGYYSAILAELVGQIGRVTAVEYDRDLAARAETNLSDWRQVVVVAGDGTVHDAGEVDAIVVFAGTTHPAPLWLDRLADGGRLLLPLTGANGRGILLKIARRGTAFDAVSLGECGFFPCIGARNTPAARRLDRALKTLQGNPAPIGALHTGPSSKDPEEVWYAGSGFWLSREHGPHERGD